jgi:hypothetical protein
MNKQIVDTESRPKHTVRRFAALGLACGLALSAAGCSNGGQAPAMQYGYADGNASSSPTMYSVEHDTRTATDETPAQNVAPDQTANSPWVLGTNCNPANKSTWSDRCYVYRGGRDPVTGRAYTQL